MPNLIYPSPTPLHPLPTQHNPDPLIFLSAAVAVKFKKKDVHWIARFVQRLQRLECIVEPKSLTKNLALDEGKRPVTSHSPFAYYIAAKVNSGVNQTKFYPFLVLVGTYR